MKNSTASPSLKSKRKPFLPEWARQILLPFLPANQSKELIRELEARWNERQRYYHGVSHLHSILQKIKSESHPDKLPELTLLAIYHDVVYRPGSLTNESDSQTVFLSHMVEKTRLTKEVEIAILESQWQEYPKSELARYFLHVDAGLLLHENPFTTRLAAELGIFQEYQARGLARYKSGRISFLKSWAETFRKSAHAQKAVEAQMEACEALDPNIAVYPGSFDPFHIGHLSILHEAEKIFDQVILLPSINDDKASQQLRNRTSQLKRILPFHQIVENKGLLPHMVAELGNPTIIRSIRNGIDLDAEMNLTRSIRDINPHLNVAWLPCHPEHQHVSSSLIRTLDRYPKSEGERYRVDSKKAYQME